MKISLVVVILLVILNVDLFCQSNDEPEQLMIKYQIAHAQRIQGTPPIIDGDMDDDIWKAAVPL